MTAPKGAGHKQFQRSFSNSLRIIIINSRGQNTGNHYRE